MPEELFVRRVRISKEIPEDDYIAGLPVIRHLTQMGGLGFRKPVTFLVGENGTGKSTLLEGLAVALGFNAEGGTLSYQFSTADSHSDLYEYLTVEKGSRRFSGGYFLRAESFYNAASYLNTVYTADEMEKYYGGSLHARSHGESFFALIEKRFQGNGLYLMDEPEAALSPTRLLSLMVCIRDLVDDGSQFIISTHSPILMTFPDAEVLELTEEGIRPVPYDETEHFCLTKQFVNAPKQFLRHLFRES